MRGKLMAAAGFTAALLAGWLGAPHGFYRTVARPVAFNHAVHTGGDSKMACQDCHALGEDGRFAGMPVLASCATCHAEPMGTTQAELKFVTDYVKTGREPQWLSNPRQPDNAWFPHAAHIKRAKLACERCHGGVGGSKTMEPLRVNVISGYSREVATRMRMNDCVACHRTHHLEHSCLDCHR